MARMTPLCQGPHMAAASTSVTSFDEVASREQRWLQDQASQGYLALCLPEPDLTPGKTLTLWLDEALERELQCHGACKRPSYVEQQAASVVPDQLYRTRMLGYSGLAVLLHCLAAFSKEGAFGGQDSLALGEWCRQARAHGVAVRFSTQDLQLRIFLEPIPLERWLRADDLGETNMMLPCPPAASALSSTTVVADAPRRPSKLTSQSLRQAMRTALEQPEAAFAPSPLHAVAPPTIAADVCEAHPPAEESPTDETHRPSDAVPEEVAAVDGNSEALPAEPVATSSVDDDATSGATSSVDAPQPGVDGETAVAEDTTSASLESLLENLEAIDGSQAWADIEALFVHSYLPLQTALHEKRAPARTESVLATWAADFATSYERAFEAIRSGQAKRPRLVLDAPSHAFQLCRRAQVEQAKLVLVDSMRADLSPLVREKLKLQLLDCASCEQEGLLWAGLPADTPTQMELIARGMDGLRHFSGALSEQQLVGNSSDHRRLRPVRVGSHRMHKLDVVHHALRNSETVTVERLSQYAAEIATSVGRFIRQQTGGTLVYVFGDHGFGGTLVAGPERVLVPYQAWKVTI